MRDGKFPFAVKNDHKIPLAEFAQADLIPDRGIQIGIAKTLRFKLPLAMKSSRANPSLSPSHPRWHRLPAVIPTTQVQPKTSGDYSASLTPSS